MSDVDIAPWVPPVGAIPGETAAALPLLASTAQTGAAQINGLIGWRSLRRGCRHHQVGDLEYDVAHVDAAPGGTWDYTDPQPVRIEISPAGRHLWVGLWYSAYDVSVKGPGGVPTTPSIEVELQTDAGVPIGDSVQWNAIDGHLEMAPSTYGEVFSLAAPIPFGAGQGWLDAWANAYADGMTPPDQFIQTGWEVETLADDDPVPLALPAGPAAVQLVVTGIGVRVYSVAYAEIYFEQVT